MDTDPARGCCSCCFPVYEPVDGSAGSHISSSFRKSRKQRCFHSREEKRKTRSVALNKEENLMGKKQSWQQGKPSPTMSLWVAQISCAIRIIASRAVPVEVP